jgi:hypothetical protein
MSYMNKAVALRAMILIVRPIWMAPLFQQFPAGELTCSMLVPIAIDEGVAPLDDHAVLP